MYGVQPLPPASQSMTAAGLHLHWSCSAWCGLRLSGLQHLFCRGSGSAGRPHLAHAVLSVGPHKMLVAVPSLTRVSLLQFYINSAASVVCGRQSAYAAQSQGSGCLDRGTCCMQGGAGLSRHMVRDIPLCSKQQGGSVLAKECDFRRAVEQADIAQSPSGCAGGPVLREGAGFICFSQYSCPLRLSSGAGTWDGQ